MKRTISTFLYEKLPHHTYISIQNGWRFIRFNQYRRLLRLEKKFISLHGFKIINGPFKDMSYISDSVGSILLPKLVGSYEYVLHKKINQIVNNLAPLTIIDIGVAEGYYLVGLGSKLPHAKLIGYDTDTKALSLTRKLYEINSLQNKLFLEDACTFESLKSHITPRTLIICDTEGFENKILDPKQFSELLQVEYLLVETHDIYVPGTKDRMIERFSGSHHVEEIVFKNIPKETYSFLDSLSNDDYSSIADERRDKNQVWLWMELKQSIL